MKNDGQTTARPRSDRPTGTGADAPPGLSTFDGASALQMDTAGAIVRWIVQNDLPRDYHLKEQKLSAVFQLSRSPIRGALTLLGRHGIVDRRPDRGFFLALSGQELGTSDLLLPGSGNDDLYRVIATEWFNGEIPDAVSTAELRRRFGGKGQDVGRALERLADDGIIVRSAGKGWRLGPNLANASAFDGSYAFRMTIEPAAIKLDTFELDRALATRSRRVHDKIIRGEADVTIKDMVDADIEFHHLIAVSCRNQFFAQAITRQNVMRRLTEMLTMPGSDRLRTSSAEHVAILDALDARRQEVAAVLMSEHLTVSRNFVPNFFKKAASRR